MDIGKDFKDKYIKNSKIKWKIKGFVLIPHAILFDEKIGRSGLMVFWILTAHMFKGKNYCFPSLTTIQKETRLSRPTVVSGIKNLKEAGYLEVEYKKGCPNKYYLKVKV